MSLRALMLVVGTAGLAGLAFAGPLTPPVGPVTSTLKTLVEVEPRTVINDANTPGDVAARFRISQSGSYYLDRSWNFATPAEIGSRQGILIDADDVTIDLRGFTLKAINNARNAIQVAPGRARVRILDGVIDNWGLGGIDAPNSGQMIIERVIFRSLGGPGIAINSGSIVRDCTIVGATTGVASSNDVIVERVSVTQVSAGGIGVGTSSRVSGCDVFAGTGIGINVGGGIVEDSAVTLMTGAGIVGGSNAVVRGCRVVDCTEDGITVGTISTSTGGCVVSECTVKGGVNGILCNGNGALVADCAVAGTSSFGIRFVNAFSTASRCVVNRAGASGFNTADSECSFLDCVATQCTGDGFFTGSGGCTVERCASRNNVADGINGSGNDNVIRHNLCDNNGGGEAILVSGSRCRVEGNMCNDSKVGIRVNGSKCLIVGNTCNSVTGVPYSIAVNNIFGAIVNPPGNVASVSGATANSSAGTTDPFANFSY